MQLTTEILVLVSGIAAIGGAMIKEGVDYLKYRLNLGNKDSVSFNLYLRQEVDELKAQVRELSRKVDECEDDRAALRFEVNQYKRQQGLP